ncbi:hypothetical protein L1887_54791 [Cichorium endivia]|nr:hypothetical protein L1887_54791 [Cichorium endivia]
MGGGGLNRGSGDGGCRGSVSDGGMVSTPSAEVKSSQRRKRRGGRCCGDGKEGGSRANLTGSWAAAESENAHTDMEALRSRKAGLCAGAEIGAMPMAGRRGGRGQRPASVPVHAATGLRMALRGSAQLHGP